MAVLQILQEPNPILRMKSKDVEKVDHELSPSDLVTIGKDIEARVLYKAIKNFSEGRVFLNGKKTIVFKGDKIL